jgi:hypothetical protein
MQCVDLPWDANRNADDGADESATDSDVLRIAHFYGEQGITLRAERIESDMAVCQACEICPTTHSYRVNVENPSAQVQNLLAADGWIPTQ